MSEEIKNEALSLFGKIQEKIKKVVNSTRIPALIHFILKPTIKEALDAAPPAEGNWIRLGLGKKLFGVVPAWVIFALPLLMVVVKWGSEALMFLIQIFSQFIMIIPLLVLGWFIWKSIKK